MHQTSCNNRRRVAGRRHELGKRSSQRGSSFIEFVVSMALLWLPLFFGVTQFGFELIQAIQVTQVCRDAGHLYAYGINFSQSSNQYLLSSFAPLLSIDPTGASGNTVVILSTVEYVDPAQCQAGGYSSTCPNNGSLVFVNQTVIGNPNIHASAFGTPTTDSYGNVAPGTPSAAGYLNQANAVVTGFPSISLSSGSSGQQYAYIAEVYSQQSLLWIIPQSNTIAAASYF